jgi:hypothetical protein
MKQFPKEFVPELNIKKLGQLYYLSNYYSYDSVPLHGLEDTEF